MMRHLGSFGTEKPPAEEVVALDWFGATVRSSPTLGELDFIEFMHVAGSLDVKNPTSIGAVMDFARACIHPDDFAAFWRLAREHRQDSQDLFDVLTSIVEAVTDRPTEGPSDSLAGPSSTAPSSTGVSSSPVVARLERAGRPDLALLVTESLEYQAG